MAGAMERGVAGYLVRAATRRDADAFLGLVDDLARFEKLPPPDAEARRRLVEDAFGPEPKYELFVGHPADSTEPVAYAVVLETYSSFLAQPTLYLEDVFVAPEHRGKGLGLAMLGHLARLAVERGYGRLEGIVLGWNTPARRFYKKTGARELDDWVFFRYDDKALAEIARTHPSVRPARQ
jgi:GNAT superfamily N-acetyltransferase